MFIKYSTAKLFVKSLVIFFLPWNKKSRNLKVHHLLGLSTLWEPSPDLWALAVSLVGNQAWPKSTHSASNSNWLSIPVSMQNSYLWLGAQNSKLSFCSFFMSLSPTVIQSWGEIPQVSPLTLLQKNGFACLPCQWTLPLFWTQTAWCLGVCLSLESKKKSEQLEKPLPS